MQTLAAAEWMGFRFELRRVELAPDRARFHLDVFDQSCLVEGPRGQDFDIPADVAVAAMSKAPTHGQPPSFRASPIGALVFEPSVRSWIQNRCSKEADPKVREFFSRLDCQQERQELMSASDANEAKKTGSKSL